MAQRIRINGYGPSESVNLLNDEINTLRPQPRTNLCMKLNANLMSSRFAGREGDLIINYGSSREIPARIIGQATLLNNPTNVNHAANKATALSMMFAANVRTVEFTMSQDVAQTWVNNGDEVFCRTELRGHSGVGIVVASVNELEDLGNVEQVSTLPDAPLYTKGIDGQHREYRVHVFRGQVLFIQQKRRASGYRDNPNYSNVVRNHGNGWIYGHLNITEPHSSVIREAVNAVAALGLDFGAVDVLSRRGEAWVLEVNTAPGLSGETNRRNFANAILSVLDGTPVVGIETTSPQGIDEVEPIVEPENEPTMNETETLLAEGTRVVMSQAGRAVYMNDSANPHNIQGVIDRVNLSNFDGEIIPHCFYYEVDWDNGTSNSYCHGQIEAVVEGTAQTIDQTNNTAIRSETHEAAQVEVTRHVHGSPTFTGTLTNGNFYVILTGGRRTIGEYCELNEGFWDTSLDMHPASSVTVIREVNLD